MIDIETLGTADDAVILEIGAVCFARDFCEIGPDWGMVVDHVEQPRRQIQGGTLQWWLDEKRISAFAELTRGSETKPLLWHALQELRVFLVTFLKKGGEVWAKGDFDLRILGHAFCQAKMEPPWDYWQARELRTVMKLAGVKATGEVPHRAVEDARGQVESLWEALDALRAGRAAEDAVVVA